MRDTRGLAVGLAGALLALPTLAGAAVPEGTSAAPGADGIGDPYFPLDGNGGIDVRRYSVHDDYDFATGRLHGWTRVTLRATADLSSLNLDFLLPVTDVTVGGSPAAFSRPTPHELTITPAAPVPRGGTVDVVVTYDGFPADHSYAGESNWLADGGEVVAMNQPHMAPWWFPANDHPRDKARMAFHITVPTGNQVIVNGRPVGQDVGAVTTTWHWRATEPMAPYLAFFAAGRFTVERGRADGRPWLLAVSNGLSPASRAESLIFLRRTPSVVHWLEGELGRYPFDTTGGLVTSLDPGFALENQTRPTYPAVGSGAVLLLVHELAHQWFGDSVAVRRWRDIWLNEGLATYLEVRWTETHGGTPAARWLRQEYDARPASSGFWKLSISDPGPAHLFDFPVYQRGAMAIQALRKRIGPADLRVLLRTWARTHAGDDGSTPEFRRLAERVSGQRLGGFFDAWLDATRRPADTAANGLG